MERGAFGVYQPKIALAQARVDVALNWLWSTTIACFTSHDVSLYIQGKVKGHEVKRDRVVGWLHARREIVCLKM